MKIKLLVTTIIILILGTIYVLFFKPSDTNPKNQTLNTFSIVKPNGKSIDITMKELKDNYEQVCAIVTSISSSGEKNKLDVKGVHLSSVLKSKNIEPNSFSTIRAIAGDGYSIEVPEHILKKREVILAFEINGKPLEERFKPMRVIVPEERAMYWARNVIKIELVQKKVKIETDKIVFLDTAVKGLKKNEYMYYETMDYAVLVKDLIETYGHMSKRDLHFISKNGFDKMDTMENVLNAYIKYTGKGAPLFLSPELPKGMHIKDIIIIEQDNVDFYSLESGFKMNKSIKIKDKTKISISDIFKSTGIVESKSYNCVSLDGKLVTIDKESIMKGMIVKKDEGYNLLFANQSIMKNILSIEVIK